MQILQLLLFMMIAIVILTFAILRISIFDFLQLLFSLFIVFCLKNYQKYEK